ncbi:HK97 gp10 family phage protein [Anaerophilus nitritogenes]|uniref:HK97 gp10 family phage protein n=1 Tax=Anaerophilus nitritogenes TaxID=2498136 RepID=UPI00101C5A08|nr:HK97 gp10 family phage protein [Anaerophilus nitritogenes]
MDDRISIEIDIDTLRRLEERYGQRQIEGAKRIIEKYTNIVSREAKQIINDYGYRDTGRLINSIKPSLLVYTNKIQGWVKAGTKYARFIHEGAEHEGDDIVKHFVPFRVAPTLLQWALRHDVIIKVDGVYRMFDTGAYVDPAKGGLRVTVAPTKFFSKPYEENKEKFLQEMRQLIND